MGWIPCLDYSKLPVGGRGAGYLRLASKLGDFGLEGRMNYTFYIQLISRGETPPELSLRQRQIPRQATRSLPHKGRRNLTLRLTLPCPVPVDYLTSL